MGEGHEQTLYTGRHTWDQQTWKMLIITGNQRNANQNPHWDTISCQLEWQSLKNLETTDAGEDVEKKEHFYTVGGSVN